MATHSVCPRCGELGRERYDRDEQGQIERLRYIHYTGERFQVHRLDGRIEMRQHSRSCTIGKPMTSQQAFVKLGMDGIEDESKAGLELYNSVKELYHFYLQKNPKTGVLNKTLLMKLKTMLDRFEPYFNQ